MKHDLIQLQARWDNEAEAHHRADRAAIEQFNRRANAVAEIGIALLLGLITGLAIIGMIR